MSDTSNGLVVGDRVAVTIGCQQHEGEVVALVDPVFGMYRVRANGRELYRYANEVTPLAGVPQHVEAEMANEGLLLSNEPLDLGTNDPQDAIVAAAIDAACVLVRICDADGLQVRERITLNGVTWLVNVRPE